MFYTISNVNNVKTLLCTTNLWKNFDGACHLKHLMCHTFNGTYNLSMCLGILVSDERIR